MMRRDHRDRKINALTKKNRALAATVSRLVQELQGRSSVRINHSNKYDNNKHEFYVQVKRIVLLCMVEEVPIPPLVKDCLVREAIGVLNYEEATHKLSTLFDNCTANYERQDIGQLCWDDPLTSQSKALISGAALLAIDTGGLDKVIEAAYLKAVNDAVEDYLKPYKDAIREHNQSVLESIEQLYPS